MGAEAAGDEGREDLEGEVAEGGAEEAVEAEVEGGGAREEGELLETSEEAEGFERHRRLFFFFFFSGECLRGFGVVLMATPEC